MNARQWRELCTPNKSAEQLDMVHHKIITSFEGAIVRSENAICITNVCYGVDGIINY